MVEALYKIAPGFRHDKDESWMKYLSPDERTEMQTKRAIFIEINEKLEDVIKKTARLSDCPPTAETNIETYVTKRNKLAHKYINEIKILKAKAEETKKRVLEEERELLTKRPRMANSNDDDEDVEMEADDYMPTEYLPYVGQPHDGEEEVVKRQRQACFAEPNLPPAPPEESYVLPENIMFGEADAYLRGVSMEDKQILSDLKPLIIKYNCRDRVLKVTENLRAIDKRKAAVNLFTAQVAKLKSK